MDTLVLGLSLFLAAACAALSVVQFAQVRALRRESRALADALSRLAVRCRSIARPRRGGSPRGGSSTLRRTAVKIAELPPAEAERSRAMIQVLRTVRPGEPPPEELLERPSGFWPTYPQPPERG